MSYLMYNIQSNSRMGRRVGLLILKSRRVEKGRTLDLGNQIKWDWPFFHGNYHNPIRCEVRSKHVNNPFLLQSLPY